jgi:hypothetical protein
MIAPMLLDREDFPANNRDFRSRVSEDLFWQDVTFFQLVIIYRQFGGIRLFVNIKQLARLRVQVDGNFCFVPHLLFYFFLIIVTWGSSDPPILFLPKNRFLTSELKRGKEKL